MLLVRSVRINSSEIVDAMQAAHRLSWDRRFAELERVREHQRQQSLEEGASDDDGDSGGVLQFMNFPRAVGWARGGTVGPPGGMREWNGLGYGIDAEKNQVGLGGLR